MAKALIGFTGFVGGNLDRQMDFDARYNTSNIRDIEDKYYTLIVSAGTTAAKWLANKEPEMDWKGIADLCRHLEKARAEKFVLISTVDVYPQPVDVDEHSPIDPQSGHPYGQHRLAMEDFVKDRFNALIVRLPGLFGAGLKKNIIYDFLHDNNVDQINPHGVFQFYCLDHLERDIGIALAHDLQLINITSEPVTVLEVAKICLGHEFTNSIEGIPAQYNYRSCYAELFGGQNGYLYNKKQVLQDLATYVAQVKEGRK